jgi:2-polyprenyl-3-methyl-5-hydroxy-6-metoxy-1,4-benzoquinol methylase
VDNIYLNGTYVEKNPTYHLEDSPWKAREIVKMINRHNLQFRTVCEIGCGAGEVLRQLYLQLSNEKLFYGYEISPQAYSRCKQRGNERLQFCCEDLLLQEKKQFDLLLCIDVFEHVEDCLGFLRKLRDYGNYKIFHIPLDISVQTVLRCAPIAVKRKLLGHVHYFTRETALFTLQDAGYEVVDWFYTPAASERGESKWQKIGRWPRRILSLVSADWTARVLGGYSMLVLAK